MVRQTGKGTRDWTVSEIEELLQNGKAKDYVGDHINGAKSSPEWQGDPRNIQFVPRSKHIDEHGYWQNPDKSGPLIARDKIVDTWED
jgi:hypothetical protein